MKGSIIAGILLILFGLPHILNPQKVIDIFTKTNLFLKNSTAKKEFVIALGVVWILVGLYVLIFM